MKRLFLSLFATALLFASCSTEEAMIEPTDSNSKLLESFIVKRNSDGSYALSTTVTDGAGTIYFDDATNNEIHLVTDGTTSRNSLEHNYDIVDNKLNISFVSENNTPQPKIQIIDDNTASATSRDTDYGLLNTYSVTYQEDGTIQLNFEVKNGVDVVFGYNYDENINDVYLTEDANATQLNYSKNYSKEADGTLRIDFVQANYNSRDTDTKKPRVMFDDQF
jgi:hypothetical protein